MLLKIHTAYFSDHQIKHIETVSGPGRDSGFRVFFLYNLADAFVPCPEELLAKVREEIDAQLAPLYLMSLKPESDPAEPKPPRGGYF